MSSAPKQPLKLSLELLDRLQIPTDKREQFCRSIQSIVAITTRRTDRYHFRTAEIAGPLERIADLSNRLVRALAAAKDGGRDAWGIQVWLEYELRFAPEQSKHLVHAECDDLLELHRAIADLLYSASMRAAKRVRSNLDAREGAARY